MKKRLLVCLLLCALLCSCRGGGEAPDAVKPPTDQTSDQNASTDASRIEYYEQLVNDLQKEILALRTEIYVNRVEYEALMEDLLAEKPPVDGEAPTETPDFFYTVKDGKATVTAYVGKATEVTVPATSAEPDGSSDSTSEPPPAVNEPPVFTEALPDYIIEPEVEMPVVEVDGISYCALVEIPSVGICLPVSADWSMETLRFTPCRYSGSAYTGNLVIAAHNYIGHFSTLGNVGIGDPVTFTDMDGNVFRYRVWHLRFSLPPPLKK